MKNRDCLNYDDCTLGRLPFTFNFGALMKKLIKDRKFGFKILFTILLNCITIVEFKVILSKFCYHNTN